MIGISVIGTPQGLEALSIGINKNLSVKSKVDLNNALISIYPNTDILRVFRERQDNNNYLYFVYYRFATEMNETRSGSFYGSVVVLENRTVRANFLLRVLQDLADVIKNECLNDESKFQRDIETLKFTRPPSVAELKENVIKNNMAVPRPSTESGFLQIGRNQELKTYEDFIDCVFQNELLSDFQTLYVSTSDEVYNSVKQKSMLQLLSFSGLEEAKKQQIEMQRQKELEAKRLQEQRELEAKREKEKRALEAKHEQERKDLEAKQSREWGEKNISVQRKSTEKTQVGDVREEIRDLKNRVIDLERKVFPKKYQELPESKNGRIKDWFLRNKWRLNDWKYFLLVIFGLLLIFIIVVYFLRDINSATSTNLNTTPLNNTTNTTTTIPKDELPTKSSEILQLNYIGENPNINTVEQLAEFIHSSCNSSFCGSDKNGIVESLKKINTSISKRLKKKNDYEASENEILKFKIKEISPPITFEISACCDLTKKDPKNFKPNKK